MEIISKSALMARSSSCIFSTVSFLSTSTHISKIASIIIVYLLLSCLSSLLQLLHENLEVCLIAWLHREVVVLEHDVQVCQLVVVIAAVAVVLGSRGLCRRWCSISALVLFLISETNHLLGCLKGCSV